MVLRGEDGESWQRGLGEGYSGHAGILLGNGCDAVELCERSGCTMRKGYVPLLVSREENDIRCLRRSSESGRPAWQ